MIELRQPASRILSLLCVIAAIYFLGGETHADASDREWRFDFGPATSDVAEGHARVTAEDAYDPDSGFGWEGDRPEVIAFPQPDPGGPPLERARAIVYANNADALKCDAAVSTSDIMFRVDVPNGAYRVRLTFGDLREPIGSIDVSMNGELAAEHVAAFRPAFRNMLNNVLGWWSEVRHTIDVQDGVLRIRLNGNQSYYDSEVKRQEVEERAWAAQFPKVNGVDIYARVNYQEAPFVYAGFPFTHHSLMGLEIVPHREAPVVADGETLRLTKPIESPALTRAVESFNSKRFSDAVAALDDVTEDDAQVARAIVQLWLVGRLEVEQFVGLLDSAIDILQPYCAAHLDHSRVAEILEDAQTFAKAHEIHVNRGDMTLGEGHFLQNARAIGYWWLIPQESPVYDRAQLFIARAAHMLVPYLPTRGTERDIFQKLERKYPDNRFIRYHLHEEWESHGDGSDYYDWVWNDYETPVEDAPAWARALYPAFQNYVDWCEWWFQYRQNDLGALGGGWGDDVEIIPAMAYYSYVSPDISPLLTEGVRKFMDGLWRHSEIDPELGFLELLADAEHAAEWTGNTLGMAAQIDYGNPQWIERCMQTSQLMRDLWTDYDADGLRRFRANYFGAARLGDHPLHANDSWINYRAIRPAAAVIWYNQNPATAQVMIELADGWLAASLSTDRGKPPGVIPRHVGFPDGRIGGHQSPTWFEPPPREKGTINRPWVTQNYKAYIQDLLMLAHQLTGQKKYLEPLRLEYELAEQYGNVPTVKTAARLQAIPDEELTVARQRREEQRRTSAEPGSEEWVAMNLQGVNTWLVAQRELVGRSGELVGDITIDDIIRHGRHSSKTLRHVFPLTTTEAGPTDRVGFVGCMNPFMISTGGRFGGPMLQAAVTYRDTTRHFAAAVLGTDAQGFRLLYYSLAPQKRDISLVPWDLEPGGRYRLRYGPDANDDQSMDEILEERDFDFPQRGTEVRVTVEPRTAYVVEVEQLARGGLPALAPDPGLSAADIRYSPFSRQIFARIHNVGSQAVRDVEVAAYDGDPQAGGVLIGKATIPNIEAPVNLAPRTTTIAFHWQPTDDTHEIHVLIDPEDRIPSEITTFNNSAHATVHRGPSRDEIVRNREGR